MKIFKITDLVIQLSLLLLLFTFPEYRLQPFYNNYYIIGGWQFVSFMVHLVTNYKDELPGLRKVYQTVMVVVLVITLLSFLIPGIAFMWMSVLFFVAPVLAVYYALVCFIEIL